MFVDEVRLRLEAGAGGDGIVAWRREKYIEFGGPMGGDGGRGASIFVEATDNLATLLDLRYRRVIEAPKGVNGGPKGMHGRSGKDEILKVPIGTQVFDDETGECLGDLVNAGDRILVAKGGEEGAICASSPPPTALQTGLKRADRASFAL